MTSESERELAETVVEARLATVSRDLERNAGGLRTHGYHYRVPGPMPAPFGSNHV